MLVMYKNMCPTLPASLLTPMFLSSLFFLPVCETLARARDASVSIKRRALVFGTHNLG